MWANAVVIPQVGQGYPVSMTNAQGANPHCWCEPRPVASGVSRIDAPIVATYAYPDGQRRQEIEQEVARANDLALWRAAELALAADYPALTVEERDREVRIEVIGGPYASPFYGYFYSPYPFGHHGRPHGLMSPAFQQGFYEPYAELIVTVTITVEFAESVGSGALDAGATLDRLRAQYPGAAAPGAD